MSKMKILTPKIQESEKDTNDKLKMQQEIMLIKKKG